MKTFLALYMAPFSTMDEWMQLPEDVRKTDMENMNKDWDAWTAEHGSMIKETRSVGKAKRASPEGLADIRNDVMMYSIVEAESHEEATKIFETHPHLQIPGSTVEVMPANDLSEMQG